MDDFTDLLLSFNSADKIQLNVISIVSETMAYQAEEIADRIINAHKKNPQLDVVMERLCSRSNTYRKLFSEHVGTNEPAEKSSDDALAAFATSDARSSTQISKTTKGSAVERLSAGRKKAEHRNDTVQNDTSGTEASKRIPRDTEHVASRKRTPQTLEKKRTTLQKPLDEDRTDAHVATKKRKVSKGLVADLELFVKEAKKFRDAGKIINVKLLDDVLFKVIQCKMCGLRYSPDEKEVLSLHLSDHQRRIRTNESKNVVSRDYTSRKSDWLVGKLNLPSVRVDKKVITSDKPQVCKVCKDKIALNWCDENEHWVLDNAVEVGGDQYCHRKCVE